MLVHQRVFPVEVVENDYLSLQFQGGWEVEGVGPAHTVPLGHIFLGIFHQENGNFHVDHDHKSR